MEPMRKLYVAAVLCLAAPFFLRAAEVVLMEEIVAKVNGDIITSAAIAIFDWIPKPIQIKRSGASAIFGTLWKATIRGWGRP